ncbi:tetratricopeptide repeat protein [Persicimonas caeni]|uniref:Tetratricopeptide repeat protein n=1 Tax=Persicimonas caeni TaxID=2292766 RepID=A0A4Y6PZQ1_PERCE|nr:transglycosylase SLT domain-containing protein [Persicimonas caeni]QDG53752.1 tetratricopeptide repeat protein [Persicimonas caeni]QED34973.1 tetratricopeptide repeat protein [Persicimonas caeni]
MLRFTTIALFLLTATTAHAQLLPESQADTYKTASKLVDEDPAHAYRLAKTLEKLPHADDRRLALLADAAANAGEVDEAIAALSALGKTAPRALDRLYAHVERGELLLLQGKLDACADAIEKADEAASALGGRSAEERFFVARRWRLEHDLALARGEDKDLRRAAKAAHKLLTDYPAEPATRREGLALSVAELDAEQRFEHARALYDSWAYHDAREEFTALLDDEKYEESARWYLAHLALNKLRDKPKEAERLFKELAKDGRYREASLYQVARAQMRQERYDDALETLTTYRKRYPRGRHTESVYYYRGWLPYDHRENKKAIEGFKNYIKRYGKSARSSYIHGFLAWTYMRLGEWQNAIDTYEEMRAFGNMLVWGKALYWQAHAFNELGQTKKALAKLDELRETYAVTYYAVLGEQLRARIEGKDPRASKVWWPDDGGKLDDAPKKSVSDFELRGLSTSEKRTWKRVQALVALGEHHMARGAIDEIYDDLVRAVPDEQRRAWIHALGHFVENYHHMWEVSTGGSIAAMPAPPEPDSPEAAMAYPRTYPKVVAEVAEEFDLPPDLMWSLMRQESRYRPAQISYTDAVGALQMIPKTARKVAKALGVTYNPRTFPIPEVGFRYSGFYLRKLLDTFDGLIVPTAAAYNSGPQIVAYWFRQNPDASFPWLIEEFAYNEGRNYCRKVAEHMVRYLYLYEDDAERRGEILDKLFPVSRDIEIPEEVGY